MDVAALAGLDPFSIYDIEASRLDHYFAGLDAPAWDRPSRCAGWSIRDVLAHLAGEEMYNHACLNNDLDGFRAMVRDAGIAGGYDEFNAWCVRQRRGLPIAEILAEWREASIETRHRMAALGRDAPLMTAAGPYPAGLQAMHYASECATHADDVGALVSSGEEPGRTTWRATFAQYTLCEQHSPVHVSETGHAITVQLGELTAELSPEEFTEVAVGRLPRTHPLDPALRETLRCLA